MVARGQTVSIHASRHEFRVRTSNLERKKPLRDGSLSAAERARNAPENRGEEEAPGRRKPLGGRDLSAAGRERSAPEKSGEVKAPERRKPMGGGRPSAAERARSVPENLGKTLSSGSLSEADAIRGGACAQDA